MRRVPMVPSVTLALVLAACSATPAVTEPPASVGPSSPEASEPAAATASPTAVVSPTPTAEPTPVVAADVTDLVELAREEAGVPAMAGAVVTSEGILAIGVSGIRRAGGSTPVTLDDVWHIGSNLKAITAMLAAIAVDDGVIDWTDTVADTFTELGSAIRPEYRDVTLLQLLSMQGGLEGWPPPGQYPATGAREQRDQVVAAGLAAAPHGPVGSYYYSNLSYVVAASMVERAMGDDYEDLVVERIGAPLGVGSIGWGPTTPSGDSQPVAHQLVGGNWTPCDNCDNPPWLSAAGRAHLTIGDWALIIGEFMRAVAGESSMISEASAQELVTAQVDVPGGSGKYGLGWNVTSRPWGGKTVTHEGSNLMNHSVAWVGLGAGVGLLAITNAGDLDGGSTSAALDDLVGMLLGWYQSQ